MSVVAKAIELLSYFSATTPEIGLSELCRHAGRDKATTYRHLCALQELGFVEQNQISKAYRIGPAVLHLAELREATVPRKEGAMGPLKALADATGETAHVSVLSGRTLHALAACESALHSTRAVIDLQKLPLHATASGACAVAFGPAELMDAAKQDLTAFTIHTTATSAVLDDVIARARTTGFGVSDRGLEDDVYGLAAPLFGQSGLLTGSVAVASVASRISPKTAVHIMAQLITASQDITRNWGGSVPAAIQTLWDATIQSSTQKADAP